MGKKKKHKAEHQEQPVIIARLHKILQFPAGWDQQPLSEDLVSQLREYLRGNQSAEEIQSERHTTSGKIDRKPRTKQTALFFVNTVTDGELVTEGVTIPARKGQLVVLPAGADFRIKYTPNEREIIEFTF